MFPMTVTISNPAQLNAVMAALNVGGIESPKTSPCVGHANNPADAPTYQDTADAVTKLARTKGRDAAVAVLSGFGAAKLPDVKPEQFAAVIAACEKAGA